MNRRIQIAYRCPAALTEADYVDLSPFGRTMQRPLKRFAIAPNEPEAAPITNWQGTPLTWIAAVGRLKRLRKIFEVH
jgi:hypothetical protein